MGPVTGVDSRANRQPMSAEATTATATTPTMTRTRVRRAPEAETGGPSGRRVALGDIERALTFLELFDRPSAAYQAHLEGTAWPSWRRCRWRAGTPPSPRRSRPWRTSPHPGCRTPRGWRWCSAPLPPTRFLPPRSRPSSRLVMPISICGALVGGVGGEQFVVRLERAVVVLLHALRAVHLHVQHRQRRHLDEHRLVGRDRAVVVVGVHFASAAASSPCSSLVLTPARAPAGPVAPAARVNSTGGFGAPMVRMGTLPTDGWKPGAEAVSFQLPARRRR